MPSPLRLLPTRLLPLLVLALSLLWLTSVACSSDTQPDPTLTPTQPPPTVTPVLTPTPEPTPTPVPATPTPVVTGPIGSMRDFVIDPSTTGKDFFDLLTEEEATCVRGAVGDAIFQIILATPIMQGGSVEAAAPLFDCLEPDSVVMFSVAIDDFVAGGRSEETRACLTALSLKHPELTYMRLGLEWKGEDTAPTGERRSSSLEYMGCLTDAEGAAYVIQLYAAIDRESPLTGSDLVDLLSESEATCVRENLSEEQFNTLLAGTPSEGVRAAAPAAVCLSPDTIGAIFLAATEVVVGGFTEDTSICISNYVEQNPAFLPLVTSNLADLPAMPASSLWEIAEGNRAMLACFTEDEFVRVEDLILAAMRP